MVGEFPQKFLWRVLIAHLVFFVVFVIAVRMARGATGPVLVTVFAAQLAPPAAPSGIPR